MRQVWMSAILVCWSLWPGTLDAATTVGPINVTASISGTKSINCTILQDNNPGNVVTSMNYGALQLNANSNFVGTKFFQFHCGVTNNTTTPYQVTQTGGTLTSGSNTLNNGSWIVTPLNGIGGNPSNPFPPGTTVGACGTAAATNKMLFTQANGTTVSDYSFTYGITDDPALGATDAIPLDQPAGNYATTITFTATVL